MLAETEGDSLRKVLPPADHRRPARVKVNARPGRIIRAKQNELLFRAVNEQIVGMTERLRPQLSDLDIVCECADPACVCSIRVTAEEFARVARENDEFIVLPGHEDQQVEQVVERNPGHLVVQKLTTRVDRLSAVE
jgi:hypothetical protein